MSIKTTNLNQIIIFKKHHKTQIIPIHIKKASSVIKIVQQNNLKNTYRLENI